MVDEIMTRDGIKRKCSKCGEYMTLDHFTSCSSRGVCRECNSEWRREWYRKRKEEIESDSGSVEHGTIYTYSLGCRCEDCTEAIRDYARDYRKRKKSNDFQDKRRVL